jgi:hypothetical protein
VALTLLPVESAPHFAARRPENGHLWDPIRRRVDQGFVLSRDTILGGDITNYGQKL